MLQTILGVRCIKDRLACIAPREHQEVRDVEMLHRSYWFPLVLGSWWTEVEASPAVSLPAVDLDPKQA